MSVASATMAGMTERAGEAPSEPSGSVASPLDDVVTAADWIARALESSGYRADFTPQSRWDIERFMTEHSAHGTAVAGGPLAVDPGSRLFALGAYLGETVRRGLGGTWGGRRGPEQPHGRRPPVARRRGRPARATGDQAVPERERGQHHRVRDRPRAAPARAPTGVVSPRLTGPGADPGVTQSHGGYGVTGPPSPVRRCQPPPPLPVRA